MILSIPLLALISSYVALASAQGVIVQLFQWSWDDIADECSYLGKQGYGYIQVSPPSEHIEGPQWWTDYQPVSYKIISKRGNRKQFKNMIDKCHRSGVGVIVDSVWNHMTGSGEKVETGIGGSSYRHYHYPDLYEPPNFHQCNPPSNEMTDWNSRYHVQKCELSGLADLATDTIKVQKQLGDYSADLLSLGVDGFRIDAAKHIAANDIRAVLFRLLPNRPYVTQEVIYGNVGEILPTEYEDNGDVQEFRYTAALKEAFVSGNIAQLKDIGLRGWIKSSKANIFVANHDTERHGQYLRPSDEHNAYVLATIFSLSFPYGLPTILSSYRFESTEEGGPSPNGKRPCTGFGGQNGWLCQHRWFAVAAMVEFYNQVHGSDLNNWTSDTPSQIAFGRGKSGFVAINAADSPWAQTFETSLPDGVCRNVIPQTDQFVTVSKGRFEATVPPYDVFAIHLGECVQTQAG